MSCTEETRRRRRKSRKKNVYWGLCGVEGRKRKSERGKGREGATSLVNNELRGEESEERTRRWGGESM